MTRHPTPPAIQSRTPLWKVDDAADFLRLSQKSVYGLVESGQLPCVRIGTRIRFMPSVLAAWVEAQVGGREVEDTVQMSAGDPGSKNRGRDVMPDGGRNE